MKRLENKYVNVTPSDLLATAAPLGSQRISGSSDAVKTYEREVSEFFGVKHAVSLNSGTVAIYCALSALGIGPGDEVILAPSAVLMSALPVSLLGARVVFADTTKQLGVGLDVDAVKRVTTKCTKALISVPLWGYPVPMTDLATFCTEAGVSLVEDIAQAHGTTWQGRLLGTFGDIGCLSTHERKLITTGEGGMVVTGRSDLAEHVQVLRRYGLAPEGIGVRLGLNFKLPAVSASLGITQVRKLSEKVRQRNSVAAAIRKGLKGETWIREIPVDVNSTANYYGMVVACDKSIDVKKFEIHLEKRGVVSDTWRYGYKPLYEYPLYRYAAGSFPRAEEFIRRVVTLPSHEGMGAAEIEQVVSAVASYSP